MRYRKLRIAFSATCLIACVLLITLWAQTKHISRDYTLGKLPYGLWISFMAGRAIFSSLPDVDAEYTRLKLPLPPRTLVPKYAGGSLSASEWHRYSWTSQISGDYTTYCSVPIWLLATLVMTLASIPWTRWSKRFRLRTLLIATTLVAVVLGLAVYAARK